MKIDGVDTRVYDTKQLTVKFTPPAPGVEYTMERHQLVPRVERIPEKLGTAEVTLLVRGESKNEVTRKASKIMGLLSAPVELTLDGFKGKYMGVLVKAGIEKMRNPQRQKLRLEFDGYLHDTEVRVAFPEGTTTGTVHRVGSRKMPCRLVLTPKRSMGSVQIFGFGEDPIRVDNLLAGHAVTIDGTTGLITQDEQNKAPDVEIWQLPAMLEEEITLTWTSAELGVAVEYTPAWL